MTTFTSNKNDRWNGAVSETVVRNITPYSTFTEKVRDFLFNLIILTVALGVADLVITHLLK